MVLIVAIMRLAISSSLSHHLLIAKAALNASKLAIAVIVSHSSMLLSKIEWLLSIVQCRIVGWHARHTWRHSRCGWSSSIGVAGIRVRSSAGCSGIWGISRRGSRSMVAIKTSRLRKGLGWSTWRCAWLS